MATRGRKPKPTHLRVIEGNPGKRPINKNEPKPTGSLGAPDDDLPEMAKVKWREIEDTCPWITAADRDCVRAYVLAFHYHRIAAEHCNAGLLVRNPRTGDVTRNPALHEMARQAEHMRKWANELGFTPSARARLNVNKGKVNDDDFTSMDDLIDQ